MTQAMLIFWTGEGDYLVEMAANGEGDVVYTMKRFVPQCREPWEKLVEAMALNPQASGIAKVEGESIRKFTVTLYP